MKINVCIGSSCHLKGSRQVIWALREKITEHSLGNVVDLCGSFCLGNCQKGVCVGIDGTVYSVTPETVGEFFDNEILPRVK